MGGSLGILVACIQRKSIGMAGTTHKKLVYREAVFSAGDKTLQSMLEEVLSKTTVTERKELLNKYEQTFRLINKHQTYSGMLFCQMLLVDPGSNQPVLIYDEGKEGFQIDAVSTKELTQEKLKQNSDFVNSMLYFGVRDNEVVVMASQAITVRALEVHLAWLLRNHPDVLPTSVSFALIKHTPRKLEDLIQQHPVKSVEIGSPIVMGEKVAAGDQYASSNTAINIGMAAVRALLGRCKASWLDGVTEESNLSARIVITYSRRTDEVGRDVMNKLGTTLRNLDEADVKLSLDGLGVVKGDDLNLSKDIKIEKTERGLFVETNIYVEMINWLIELRQEKETS